ncbi:MAG TPA: hypothetical protein PL048_18940 [Leptospiraceae bacterium]|nr:hypothetical protein [Leptospiraceae bacterium]HMY69096.1 hypothetical protein [Leptospiraceae bacterium]HMZ60860.1 hypothetical protein [Leptospiraceae bacterium]HNF13541.1 hypothetical protein [Leptospiraceae bacterium]HNF24036.1 hypothetical protein [Leptospiraceae bacterium]
MEPNIQDMMELQLDSLYAEKELLEKELGISDPVQIVRMIQSMQIQLEDLYSWKENYETEDISVLKIYGNRKVFIKRKEKEL